MIHANTEKPAKVKLGRGDLQDIKIDWTAAAGGSAIVTSEWELDAVLALVATSSVEGQRTTGRINAVYAGRCGLTNTVTLADDRILSQLILLYISGEVAVSGGSADPFGPTLHEFGARTTQEQGPNFDSSEEIQRALDYGGTLRSRGGNYLVTDQLRMRPNTRLKAADDNLQAAFLFYNLSAQPPFVIDGSDGTSDGSNAWVYDISIEDMWFDFFSCAGTAASEMVSIDHAFSCEFTRWRIHASPDGVTPLKIGAANHLTFRKQRIDGNATRPQLIKIDSTTGAINLLVFDTPDLESGEIGINCVAGNAHRVQVDVHSLYTEALGTAIKWDAGGAGYADESRLSVFGGNIIGRDINSIGADIRRSHATISGLSMGSIGGIGVDIDNATSWANCHVIGGNLHVNIPVRDTHGRLKTNTYA